MRLNATRLSVALVLMSGLSAFAIDFARTDLSAEDAARVNKVTAPTTDFSKPEAFEVMQGGAATTRASITRDSFSHFSANLSFEQEEQFKLGNALFRKLWVSSPSSTLASDGLGPLFNARSCQSCHVKDGRGRTPDSADEKPTSVFLRLSVPPRTQAERDKLNTRQVQFIGDPIYGGQLQNRAVPGMAAEGDMQVTYEPLPVTLDDGTVITLRKPSYAITDPAYGDPDPDIMLSARVAPQMIGLGLVEQIHPADILAHADPDDVDGDGISGRANYVGAPGDDPLNLGRFGWKASAPTIRLQSASAFAGDIGISTPDVPLHAGECTASQTDCLNAPNGVNPDLGDTEAPDPVLDLVTFYSQNLAVPARRDVGAAQVLRGKRLFYESGCASCHVPKFVTRRDAPNPAHAFQLIWPYSDFLLHDMGEGLADHRPVGDADGDEWRTAPLWGIGLTKTVSGFEQYLHDGRARTLLEAVLWHGGEAAAARNAVVALPKKDRDALIAFLESL